MFYAYIPTFSFFFFSMQRKRYTHFEKSKLTVKTEPLSTPKNISNNAATRWNPQNEHNETLDPILLPRYIYPVSTHFDTRIFKFNHCQSSSRRERGGGGGEGEDQSVRPPRDIPADKVALDWISRCRLYGGQQCVTRCAITLARGTKSSSCVSDKRVGTWSERNARPGEDPSVSLRMGTMDT